ncbi:MAG: LacI family DNA-binding transcriptional regulator [Blautia sp.]|nr:LacI family DNA-binding transcriptional regulator [Blautia sp.]
MKKNSVTFDDIAKYTGFSKTTISRYFNKPESITPENQEKIRKALIALDYKENKVAKILANGESQFVGVLIPSLYLHYFGEMVNQLLLTYEKYGYKFLLFVGNQKPDVERRYIQELLSYQVEGLLVMSHTLPSKELSSFPIPVVSIEREDSYTSSVRCDNRAGALMAVKLLEEKGCEVFLHLNTPTAKNVPAYERLVAFQEYCSLHELPHQVFIQESGQSPALVQKDMEVAFQKIEASYAGKKKGIFLSDDTRANAMLNQIVRKYGALPEEYRLVGFDNSPISESAIYPITTVSQQIPLMAQEAIRLLSELIKIKKESPDKPLPLIHKVVAPQIFIRETT